MLILILTPFVIFLVSEHFGLSGILAVVAGGIVHAIERDYTESTMAKLQVVSNSTWSVIIFILNGLVFLILGLQIPDVISVIYVDEAFSNVAVFAYIIIISAALIVLRFVWIYLFWEGAWIISKKKKTDKPRFRSAVLTSLSGVRGAVTLAGAFSIPYFIQDGSPFPQRDLLIFIAAGVILFTLIAASILLPMLSKKDEKARKHYQDKLEAARNHIIAAAVKALKEDMTEHNKAAALAVVSDYESIMKSTYPFQNDQKSKFKPLQLEKEIRLIACKAEQAQTQQLLQTGQISREVADRFLRAQKVMDASLSRGLRLRLIFPLLIGKRLITKLLSKFRSKPRIEFSVIKTVKIQTSQAAMAAIEEQMNEENRAVSKAVHAQYAEIVERLHKSSNPLRKDEQFDMHKRELQYKAIQVERNEVQVLFEKGNITREIANQLRRFINDLESTMLVEDD
ncbi:Sodium, potassium, lithium and rubidium/H(+) antiporter [compost metagenome]